MNKQISFKNSMKIKEIFNREVSFKLINEVFYLNNRFDLKRTFIWSV